ncbi:MAG: DNA polymerase III subunit epsilon [Azospirillum sp.]|nr:DNA polymerase III subunit epsilon [Azospirillum sp.]MCZ8121804.1 DNA polymerase III subunit epsilon [Magnetospirillum sp.]
MREIVLDTETTGLDPSKNRIVEIACVELLNHVPTGRTFHKYVNPEMEISPEAAAVHGITNDKVKDAPVFGEIAGEFLDFAGDAKFVIHNAEFDMGFINAELGRLGFEKLPMSRALDTVRLARQKFPGAPASLDALCKRFEIDNSHRTLHGALLDADLLAQVYLELIGGRQARMELGAKTQIAETTSARTRQIRPARAHAPSEAELAAHAAAVARLKGAVWLN